MLRDPERFEEHGSEPEPAEGQRVVATGHGTFVGYSQAGNLAAVRQDDGIVIIVDRSAVRLACPGCEDGDWQADFCDECEKHGIDADTDRVVDDGGRDSIIRTR